GELPLGQRDLVPLNGGLPLQHGHPFAMPARESLGDKDRLLILYRRREPAAALGIVQELALAGKLPFRRRLGLAQLVDPESGLEQRVAQPRDVESRVTARSLAQQLIQSRLQAFEHGRVALTIDEPRESRPPDGGRT